MTRNSINSQITDNMKNTVYVPSDAGTCTVSSSSKTGTSNGDIIMIGRMIGMMINTAN